MTEIPGQLPLWEEAEIPWGKPALVEVPEKFWSSDWLRGVRSKTYLGEICGHLGDESRVCVQPRQESQGAEPPPCVPFDPERAKIRVLPGRLGDYT